jgi:hypothetical protein
VNLDFPAITSFQTKFSIRPLWSSGRIFGWDRVLLRLVLGDNILFLGVLYQMLKNLLHERPQLEKLTNYFEDERETAKL